MSTSKQQQTNSNHRPEARVRRFDNNVHCLWLERLISVCIICILAFFFIWLFLVIILVYNGNPKFMTSSMLVSSFNTSNSLISTNWTIGLLVTNTNHQTPIIYDVFEVLVYEGNGQYLCRTTHPGFGQESRKQTNVIIGPKVCTQVLNTSVIPENYVIGGVAFFEIHLRVRYRHVLGKYLSWIWPGKNWKKASVHCNNVEVWFPFNGTQGVMEGKMKHCIP